MIGTSKYFKILLITIIGVFFSVGALHAQYTKEDTLKFSRYYKKCKGFNKSDSIVLKMTDTLINYAENFEFGKGVTLAMFMKMNYYIHHHITDSVVVWSERIKAHTLITKERNHYFLAWRNLASYYIYERYFTLALKEIEKMPEVATQMNYIQGVIESYRMLSSLYYSRGAFSKSIEYMEKAIAMDEEYKIDDYNLYTKYRILTLSYIEIKDFDKAKECLDKGFSHSLTNDKKASIYRGYLKLYIEKGDKEMAKAILDTLSLPKYKPNEYLVDILSLKAQYYYLTSDYSKALDCYRAIRQNMKPTTEYLIREAKCYERLGRYKESMAILNNAYRIKDSLQKIDTDNEVLQQMAMLEVNSINAERDKLSKKLHGARMEYLKYGIIGLIVVLGIFIFLTIKYLNMYRRLMKSEGTRSVFLNHISHEIRTPLNSIVGFTHILLEDANLSNNERSKCVDAISESSESLLKIITSATDVSDVDSIGKDEAVDINQVCNSVADFYSDKVKSEVRISVSPMPVSTTIFVNRSKIEKLLYNVIDNSVKFTEKGLIIIEPSVKEKMLTITVTDTGPGIPKDKQEEVFDYFITLNEYGQGLGLGLSICRQITDSLKGTIVVDKSYEGGCRIIITIPL